VSRAPRRRGLVALAVACVAIAASAAICQVWTRLRAIEYGYKLSRATKLHAELLDVHRRLRLEAAMLTNPSRIARVASDELGLRPPAPEQVRRLRVRGKLRDQREASASRAELRPRGPSAPLASARAASGAGR
jgi:cell division protein FtsL